MLEMKGEYYYNSIEINNVEDKKILIGEIFINSDGWCEGIVTHNSKENLIVGIFNKFKNFELYEITSDIIYKYCATKGFLQYDGTFEVLGSNSIELPFYLKCSQLRQDPRDNYCTEEITYLKQLELFKKILFRDEKIKGKYEYILENKEEIKERLKTSEKVK